MTQKAQKTKLQSSDKLGVAKPCRQLVVVSVRVGTVCQLKLSISL